MRFQRIESVYLVMALFITMIINAACSRERAPIDSMHRQATATGAAQTTAALADETTTDIQTTLTAPESMAGTDTESTYDGIRPSAPTVSATTYFSASSTDQSSSSRLGTTAIQRVPGLPVNLKMNNPAIKYHGRTMVDAGSAWLDWSASGLELNVRGGRVRAKILAADSNDLNCVYMAVYINGSRTAKIRLSAGTNWYTLADQLPSGSVTNVKLYRLNEAAMATATVKELEITGELRARTPDSTRRIEWIGDSITAGYGVLAKQSDPFTSETEDALYTYAALASESLGADYHILAASGYGVATSNGGSTDSGLLPLVYPYTSFPRGTLEKYLWDYKRFEPDVIVVNLGTNDYAGAGGSASGLDRLKTAIPAFLTTLRKAHPGAVIVWAYGLMIDGYLNDIRAAVEGYAAADGNTYFIALPQQRAANGYGSGGHPNAASHLEAGGIMAAELEALMGWQ